MTLRLVTGSSILLGPNGAGKSTLLKLAAGVLRPDSGNISLEFGSGTLVGEASPRIQSGLRAATGWMSQRVPLIAGLSVREHVAYAGWLKGMSKSAAWASAPQTLALVDLDRLATHRASTISDGQRRRMGVAMALAHDPPVLLLDEPTAGLDPAQRRSFRQLIQELRQSRVIVVSTHQTDDIATLGDSVAVINAGRLRWSGSVAGFLAHAPGTDEGIAAQAEQAYIALLETAR